MTKERARELVGNRPRWELEAIKRALSKLELLNTPEENQRLEAVKILLGRR